MIGNMKKVLKYIFLYPIAYAYYKPRKTLKIVGCIALCICLGVLIYNLFPNNKGGNVAAQSAVNSSVEQGVVGPMPATVTVTENNGFFDDKLTVDADATAPSVSLPVIKEFDIPDFLCEYVFVYDVNNEEYLYMNGHDAKILPASTTKLLTILYARTLVPLDLKVTPGDELKMLGANSSIAHLTVKHTLTVEHLIEGMLLPSGNDAAHVLAAAGGRAIDPTVKSGQEAVAVFMKGMNEYAKKIGLRGSNFITPDGYDKEGHYSTVEDMAIVARLAYNDPIIRKYCAVPQDTVIFASGHKITWKNTNNCVNPNSKYYCSYINGLKTGTANDDYYCFIGSAVINGSEFVFGFFGETKLANRFNDAITAVNWLKNSVLFEKNN